MLLTYMDDIDECLNRLEGLDGYLFKLSSDDQVVRISSRLFFDRVERTILEGDKEHTVIIIEGSPRRYARYARRRIEQLGNRIDGKRTHHIYAFFIPSEFFQLMLEEFTDGDWD